MTLRCLLNPWR
ncbi:putative membrane protein, partial [Escherichia coli 93.0056]